MANDIIFTEEEIKILSQNPYVLRVTPTRINYTLAFKRFVLDKAQEGISSVKIFRMAGFDPDMLGKPRIYAALKTFKREASSPSGLQEARMRSEEEKAAAFAKKNLEEQKTKTAIKELQRQIVHLEQQLEFLKKIHSQGL